MSIVPTKITIDDDVLAFKRKLQEASPLMRPSRFDSIAREIKKLEFDLVCEAIKSHMEEKAQREQGTN